MAGHGGGRQPGRCRRTTWSVVRTRISPWLRMSGRLRRRRAGRAPLRRCDRPFVTSCPRAAPSTWSWPAPRCAGAGTRRPGRRPGRRRRRAAGLPRGDHRAASACGSTRRPSRSRRSRRCPGPPAWSAPPLAAARARAASWPAYASFGPGDRLRRIDWRVSLRTRQLHVAATLSDRDAEVVVLLDVLAEAGPLRRRATAPRRCWTPRSGPPPRSPSTTCTGATGCRCWSTAPAARRLRPATGRRQYLTVLEWLLDVRADASAARAVRPGLRPAAALLGRAGGGAHPAARRAVGADAGPAGPVRPVRGGGRHAAGRRCRRRSDRGWADGGVPAVAAGAGQRDRPAPGARRAGGALGRRRQPRPGAAGRGPAGHGPEGGWPDERGDRAGCGRAAARAAVAGSAPLPLLVRGGDLRSSRWPGSLLAYPAEVLAGAAAAGADGGRGAAGGRPAPGRGRPSPRWSWSVGWLLATAGYDRPVGAVAAARRWPRCSIWGTRSARSPPLLPYDGVVDPDADAAVAGPGRRRCCWRTRRARRCCCSGSRALGGDSGSPVRSRWSGCWSAVGAERRCWAGCCAAADRRDSRRCAGHRGCAPSQMGVASGITDGGRGKMDDVNPKRILVVGAGHVGLYAALRLSKKLSSA